MPVHPVMRQNFAGKTYTIFYNIWDPVISTSSSQKFWRNPVDHVWETQQEEHWSWFVWQTEAAIEGLGILVVGWAKNLADKWKRGGQETRSKRRETGHAFAASLCLAACAKRQQVKLASLWLYKSISNSRIMSMFRYIISHTFLLEHIYFVLVQMWNLHCSYTRTGDG